MRAIEASNEKSTSTVLNGYQWKHLFLPIGSPTLLDASRSSPSQFSKEVHGTCRNAWKTIWLLLPNETEWKLANEYRGVHPVIRARKSTFKNKKAALSTFKTKRENELEDPGDSLLHIATQLNNLELMEELLKDGCDANRIGEGGKTLLQCVQSEEACSLLLEYGAVIS